MVPPLERRAQEHQKSRGLQQAEDESTCCSSEDCVVAYSRRQKIIRMAISASHAPQIQAYLTAYEASLGQSNKTSQIQLSILPSNKELHIDIRHDLRTQSGLYDGYIIPQMMMGDLLEYDGLATLSLSGEGSDFSDYWQDLLPYYRNQMSTSMGKVRGIPVVAGNQPLLLYRADYLSFLHMPVPVTWGEYARVAEALHEAPIGPDGAGIYGSCLGRLSEAACRSAMDQQQGYSCNSMSMSYIGMTLASMTQVEGTSTGWLFDYDTTDGMKPLLNPSLETALVYMEQQQKFGAPHELETDSSLNLELFRQGQCAMTVAFDHPKELLSDPNVGFAKIPGSHSVLSRLTGSMVDCSPEFCPFGTQNENWGIVNYAPFGATDMMVGAVSTFASNSSRKEVLDFFRFIINYSLDEDSGRHQPLTYSGLKEWEIDGYEELMLNLTESANVAAPLWIPNSFDLWSEVDNQVYDYLANGNFSPTGRRQLRERVEASWELLILQQDVKTHSVPTAVFYEKVLAHEHPPDLYIGKAARIIGWTMAGLVCFLSLSFAFWVWRYQNTRIIRASQAMFLYLICFGTLMMATSIFLFGVEDDTANSNALNKSCMGSMWLYGMGYALTFTPLSAKVWLINRTFRKARNMQRVKLEGIDVLKQFLILGGINFILLTTWNATDPVVWERSPIDQQSSSLNMENTPTYGYCNSEHYRVYLGLMLGINYFASLITLVQAYECRKVSTDYDEFLWIGASLIAIVEVWSVGLPLLKLLDDDPNAVFLVKVGVVFLTTICIQLFIFLPKLRYHIESLRGTGSKDEKERELGLTYNDPPSVTTCESEDSMKNDPRMTAAKSGGKKGWGIVSGMSESQAPEGIRIMQTIARHSEELDKVRKGLYQAEFRNKALNERLERLQEKMEQYLVSRHPGHITHGNNSSNNFILWARSEQVKPSG